MDNGKKNVLALFNLPMEIKQWWSKVEAESFKPIAAIKIQTSETGRNSRTKE